MSQLNIDRGAIRRLLQRPLRGRTYLNLLYLAVMFPLGVVYFTIISIGFSVGLPLVILGIGIPILLVTLAIAVELTQFERFLLRNGLGVEIPAAEPQLRGGIVTRSWRFVTDLRVWKGVVYLLSVFLVGSATFGLLAPLMATAGSFLLAPLYFQNAPVIAYGPIANTAITLELFFGWDNLLVGLSRTFQLGAWEVQTLPGAVFVSGLGLLLLGVLVVLADFVVQGWSRYAQLMLPVPRYWSVGRR